MKEERRRRIMAAAEKLATAGRLDRVTMEDVARRAGVGKGTLYRYFPSKEELFFEVALSGHDALCAIVRREGCSADGFGARLVRVCAQVSAFYRGRRQLLHVMHAEERRAMGNRGLRRARWLERRAALRRAVEELLAEGRRDGLLRGDVPLPALAAFLLGMLRTRGREGHGGPDGRVSDATLVSLFLEGAGARR